MKREPVSSSNLRSVGYDAAARMLEIEFQNGRVYQYLGVPESVYRELMSAESLGQYFDRVIKNGYSYQEMN